MSINIPITIGDKDYMIQSDSHGYQIAEKRFRKNKDTEGQEEFYAGIWFYGKAENLMSGILELKLRKSDAKSIEELRDILIQAKKEITEIWNTNFKGKK